MKNSNWTVQEKAPDKCRQILLWRVQNNTGLTVSMNELVTKTTPTRYPSGFVSGDTH